MAIRDNKFEIVAAILAGAPYSGVAKHYNTDVKRLKSIRHQQSTLKAIADAGGTAAFRRLHVNASVVESIMRRAEEFGWRRPVTPTSLSAAPIDKILETRRLVYEGAGLSNSEKRHLGIPIDDDDRSPT